GGGGRERGSHYAGHVGRQVAHRGKTHRQEPGTAVLESCSARRRYYSFGGRGRRARQTGAGSGRKPRTTPAPGVSSYRFIRGFVRIHALLRPVREEGR